MHPVQIKRGPSCLPTLSGCIHATASPNSRRVRIFLAEKALNVALLPVDLGQGEQHSEAYRAINPRHVVPTLVLTIPPTCGALQRWYDKVAARPSTTA
jgi:Glutathione S-transferase, N-terminal domain